MPRPEHSAADRPGVACVIGWDIGGAHVKACLLRDGRVVDVAQWACPLWQGLAHLQRVLLLARSRWPQFAGAMHAVTMTGEMTDLFEHREDGVRRIAALLAEEIGPSTASRMRFFGGDGLWCTAAEAGAHWQRLASANWLATATHTAQCLGDGILIDIGSTTTDLIAFQDGRVVGGSRSDAQRLESGELVYQGVVRTPLCALGPRIGWRGRTLNVMNEFFASTADVYRLTGELDPEHDLQPAADNAPKSIEATQRRLARMIGLDAREAAAGEWLAFAQAWRDRQIDELASQLARVVDLHGIGPRSTAVSAGCGDFLVADVLARAGASLPLQRYGGDVARLAAGDSSATTIARWAQVCAPSVAVAALFDREQR